MFVVLGGRELELVVHDPSATVGDLAAAAGVPVEALRGIGVPAETPLAGAGIRNGTELDRAVPHIRPSLPAVAVVGGLDAGRRVVLRPGRIAVGRGSDADVALADASVPRHHAVLDVGVDGRALLVDHGSHNGTWLGADDREECVPRGGMSAVAPGTTVRLGATEIAVARPIDDAPKGADPCPHLTGTVPHNRPPRVALPPPVPAVEVPEPPSAPAPSLPLGVVAVVAPLVLAGLMVVVLGNPVFAFYALLSPVLAIGGHAEARRRRGEGTAA